MPSRRSGKGVGRKRSVFVNAPWRLPERIVHAILQAMTGSTDRDANTPPSAYRAAVGGEAGAKHFASAVSRNAEPIIGVLREVLPAAGRALEIAGGTGQHAVAFARAFPGIEWRPSDADAAARASIAAWMSAEGLENIAPPLAIDTTVPGWEAGVAPRPDAILCINMIHIAPWAACEGLLRGAGSLLAANGVLYLYGPYKRDGRHTAPSNEAFDASLRARNPEWGVRDLAAVADRAGTSGLALERTVEMPANNLSVIFRREA
jgi:hypothetical protein